MTMIDVFIPLKGFLKPGKLRTDNTVFRLHYRATVVLLVVSMLLVTSKQLFGEPIHCVSNDGDSTAIYKEAANDYCWIYGTYTVRSHLKGTPGKHYPQPGLGLSEGPQDEIRHAYYQWVFVVLMLQAFMFYVPHYLWKGWENGRLKSLIENLDGPSVPAEWYDDRRTKLVEYLVHSNMFSHNIYAMRFAFCEILNLINAIVQIFFLNRFLGGSFLTYGSAVASFTRRPDINSDLELVDPMTRFFPKATKCIFRHYGPSGGIETKDFLCILPINVINEKIYVVLWFWLILLAVISSLKVIQRVLVFSCSPLRILFTMAQLRHVKHRNVSKIVTRFSFGDWFVLHQLGKNLNPMIYKDLIEELSKYYEQTTMLL